MYVLVLVLVVDLISMCVKWWRGELIYDVCVCHYLMAELVTTPSQPPLFACLPLFVLNGSTAERSGVVRTYLNKPCEGIAELSQWELRWALLSWLHELGATSKRATPQIRTYVHLWPFSGSIWGHGELCTWLVIIHIGSYEVRILQDDVGVVNASS